jgi:hypothetical protein
VLRETADYLDRHGWTQQSFYDLCKLGDPLPAACLVGGIRAVVCGEPQEWLNSGYTPVEAIATMVAAQNALADYLGIEPDSGPFTVITQWNDDKDRTAIEAIAALRAAADAWDDGHPQGGTR